jgi:hypothetical protein
MEPKRPDLTRIWQLLIRAEQQPDGSWRAAYPGAQWYVTGETEEEAEANAVDEAFRRGEDANQVARTVATTRHYVEVDGDDPRLGRVWRWQPLTEPLADGTWRAWFASGGWSVTAPQKKEAEDKATKEWARRGQDPERRVATMRRHVTEPVPGVSMWDKSVLDSAWQSDNPAQAVSRILDKLSGEGGVRGGT